jgi:hypothetical protein
VISSSQNFLLYLRFTGGDCEDYYILRYDAVTRIWRNLLPQSSDYKNKLRKQTADSLKNYPSSFLNFSKIIYLPFTVLCSVNPLHLPLRLGSLACSHSPRTGDQPYRKAATCARRYKHRRNVYVHAVHLQSQFSSGARHFKP